MGFCKDCIYYGLVPEHERMMLSDTSGCTLTDQSTSDYDSCEGFVAK